jgi:hypothetical protein
VSLLAQTIAAGGFKLPITISPIAAAVRKSLPRFCLIEQKVSRCAALLIPEP